MKRALLAVALAATLGAKAADEQPSLNMHFSIAVASSVTADIVVPTRLDQPVRLRDRRSSVAIDVTLLDGAAVPATPADDDGRELVFRNALPGADVSIRTTERGFEDFTRYKQRPDREQARYAIDLENAAGLRLVDDVLEVLDAAGAPRLRMKRPWVRGGDGVVHRLGVKVTGCAIDTSPVAPWGRTPTPPGATRCLLTLDWSREGVQYPALLDPGWTTTDEMSEGRYDATLCPTVGGRAIVAGGLVDADLSLTSAELFDPATETWAVTQPMANPRNDPVCVQLLDGRTLFVGGFDALLNLQLSDAEVYEPASAGWSSSTLAHPRRGSTLTVLVDGRVLVVGSRLLDVTPDIAAELFDPGTNQWSPAGPVLLPRHNHAAFRLPDGRVMVSGGATTTGNTATSEVFDPMSSSWTPGPPLVEPRASHRAAKMGESLLVIGGYDGSVYLDSVEAFDLVSEQWELRNSTPITFVDFVAASLPSGRVLVNCSEAELVTSPGSYVYDGASDQWLGAGESVLRSSVASLALSDGRVLIAGGYARATVSAGSELFAEGEPGEFCEDDATCSSLHCADAVCCDTSCNGVCEACGPMGICGPVLSGPDFDSCAGELACSGDGQCLGASAASCESAEECANGHCVDGFCCDRSCDGTCEACDGSVPGECAPVVGEPHGDRPRCAPGFVCDGLSIDCIELGLCEGDHLVKNPDGSTTDCSPFACAGDGTCYTSCDSYLDCAAPFICDVDGSCINPRFERSDPGCGVWGEAPRTELRWLPLLAPLAMASVGRSRGRRTARSSSPVTPTSPSCDS